MIDFVSENLGPEFVESPPIQLPTLYKDTSNTIPLIFILSPGSDPMSSFLRFAKDMNYMDRFVYLTAILVILVVLHTFVHITFSIAEFMPSLLVKDKVQWLKNLLVMPLPMEIGCFFK